MRFLLLLILAGAGAYFTVPTRAAHEAAARAHLQTSAESAPAEGGGGVSLDDVIGYAKGMFAGEGRYENYYLFSKYAVDMPGAAYLECWGAYTLVQCREARTGAN